MDSLLDSTYQQHLNHSLGEVGVFYVENGIPHIFKVSFWLGKTGQITSKISPDTGSIICGYQDHITTDNIAKFDILRKSQHDPGNYVQDLVKMEMSFHTDRIGEPIDAIEISETDTARWITPKRNCDIDPFYF